MTKEEKDIPTSITTDMFTQLMLEKKAIEKDLEQNPIDMDMTKALILGLLLGIDKKPDEKDKLREDLVKVFAPEQNTGHWIDIKNKCGTVIAVRCSHCEKSPKHAIKSDYCPHCGAKMLEPQESEK